MYTYKFVQWLLFFYIYCFLGWCFESTYVSIRKRQLINRGFLKGPFLPIYGSGAIAVLLAALPYQDKPVAVYFVGLMAATLLELVTGMVMESLFKVRYWDYSNQKFNFKGHICLSSSIAWGFFSVAMIYGFHRPIERFVLNLPDTLVTYGTYLLTIGIAADFATSFKTAMELREVLITIEKVKNEMRLMQKRAEVIEAILADEAEQRKEHRAEKKEQLVKELEELKSKQLVSTVKLRQKLSGGKDKINMLRRNPTAQSVTEYSPSFESLKSGFYEMCSGWKLKGEDAREKIAENIVERILEMGRRHKK
jgi:uncharacterized membrane protein